MGGTRSQSEISPELVHGSLLARPLLGAPRAALKRDPEDMEHSAREGTMFLFQGPQGFLTLGDMPPKDTVPIETLALVVWATLPLRNAAQSRQSQPACPRQAFLWGGRRQGGEKSS